MLNCSTKYLWIWTWIDIYYGTAEIPKYTVKPVTYDYSYAFYAVQTYGAEQSKHILRDLNWSAHDANLFVQLYEMGIYEYSFAVLHDDWERKLQANRDILVSLAWANVVYAATERLLEKIGAAGRNAQGAAGNIKWTGKDFNSIGKNATPNELIDSLENSGWTKTVEAGGGKSGPATILVDPVTGIKVRIHATPGVGVPYFRVQNSGSGYLDHNGLFPSNATKQEFRDLTHFYFGQ